MSNVAKIAAPAAEGPTFLDYIAHPLAALMPMMDDDAFARHKDDIAKVGIREPITRTKE